MNFSFLLGFCCLLQLSFSTEFSSFLDDLFSYKNIKSIFVWSCSARNDQLTFSWRKTTLQPISMQLIRNTSDLSSLTGRTSGETIGIVFDPACHVSQTVSSMKHAGLLEVKFIAVAWNEEFQNLTLDENLMSVELRNAVDLFYVATNGSGVLLYNQKQSLVMTWNAESGLIDLGYTDRMSLSGKTVRGMVSLNDRRLPDSELRPVLERKSSIADNLMKFSFVIHQYLEEMYDFRWDFSLAAPQASEDVYDRVNGSLTYNLIKGGQFEALKTSNVDVGLFPAEQLPAGTDFLDFLQPFATFRQVFVFSSPVMYLEPHIVYSQFSVAVWGVSIALSLFVAIVSSASAVAVYVNEEESKELTFVTNILNIVGAMAQQGLERTSTKISVKVAHFSLLFLTVMLFMFYNTGLLMYTLSPSQEEIRSFGELLRRGYLLTAEDTPYNKFQLQGNYSHPDEWFYHNCQSGWGTCRTEMEFNNFSFGAGKVRTERAALFGYGPNIYAALEEIMTDRELNDLREVAVHKPYLISAFVRKHFPHKELFSRGLLLLKEAGIIYHEDQTWNAEKPDPLIDAYFVIASLYSTSVAFCLLFAGIFASLVVFSLEILARRKSLQFWHEMGPSKHSANRRLVSPA